MPPLLLRTGGFLLRPPKPLFINLLRRFTFFHFTLSTFSSNAPASFRKTFSHIFQDCTIQRALEPGKQAHSRMIVTNFEPTIFVSNCLLQMYIKCSCLDYANKVFDNMSQRDVVTWNAMIAASSSQGNMETAHSFFDTMPERDVISWNSLMSGYVLNGDYRRSVEIFARMGKEGLSFDRTSFAIVLKACSCLEEFGLGIQLHAVVFKVGLDSNVMAGSALVDMYAKCKKLSECAELFNELPEKNCVSWSAVIAGCVQNNKFFNGLKFFKEMQREGFEANQSTYASVMRSCASLCDLRLGSQLHGHALKNNGGKDTIVETAILDMYAKCGNIFHAREVFNLLPCRSLQSHNAIIVGYARYGLGYEALEIFQLLLKSDLGFDEISLSGAFSACAVMKRFLEGIQVHGLAVRTPFHSNVCVANAILDMYGKSGALIEAREVFDYMETRDAVSWNAIIASYEQNGEDKETALLFVSMLQSGMEPDEFTYGSLLKACAGQQALNHGMEIHTQIIKSGMGLESFVGSALVDMYSKCGKVEEAEKLHVRLETQTIVSWNAIISGLSLHEQGEEAQRFFCRMIEMGVKPDNFTYATILDVCANLATIALGKQVHAQIIKQELLGDAYVTSTLVDMYSKCGELVDCRLVFEKAPNRDFVTWNAMLCSYSQHGLGENALDIFEKMQVEEGVKPNHATFVAVLRACAHMGLVEKGLHYFNSMQVDYGLNPQMDHYSCMVDILGRSGQVIQALKLIQEMPFDPDDVVWRTLLSICKMHKNVEVAEIAAGSLMQLDPEDSSACVLLSNIYADAGMWEEVSRLRQLMRHGRLKKEPGCSWVEIKSEVHMFLVGDKAHPRCEDIYEYLHILLDEMKWVGYVSCTEEPGDEYLEFSLA